MKRPKIVAEAHVPYLDVLAGVADLVRLAPEAIDREAVKDADALIVRTRTRCDAALLEGTAVKVVATATIGIDHIDLPWCRAAGIEVVNAPGCNAPAVAQYVFASVMQLVNRPLKSYTLGIVGVGNVGSLVEKWARSMHMRVMLCDPPRQAVEGGDGWSTLADIAREADIITFHTPLTRGGKHPTHHLADEAFFKSLRRAPIVINSARGPVADNQAWADAVEAGLSGPAVVDCWEGEPAIDSRLLGLASIATPHIAGYSVDGKKRASRVAVEAVCRVLGLPQVASADGIAEVAATMTPAAVMRSYNPLVDTAALRSDPQNFERLRNGYNLRAEAPVALDN